MLNGWGDYVDFNFFPDSSSLIFAQKNNTDLHSVFGDPDFIDPLTGNYHVKNSSRALLIGYKNFSMSAFGVTSPKLKQISKKPAISKQLFTEMINEPNIITVWFGASLKKISGLNERSATGMKDEEGVYITQIESGSMADKFGLKSSKTFSHCLHKVKINSISMNPTPYDVNAYNVNLNVEGEDLGEDFEGFKGLVKENILDFELLTRFNILFAIDDRQQVVDMWRRRGITALQCAKGDF
jgi:hypothetical protein